MTIESVMQNAGHFGPFQLCLILATQCCRIMSTWGLLMMVFGSYNPGWNCVVRNDSVSLNNQDLAVNSTITEANINKEVLSGNYILYQEFMKNRSDALVQVKGSCEIVSSCEYIQFDPSSVTVVTQWALLCDKSWVPSVMISLHMAGMLVGCSISGQISESFGRRVALYANTGLLSLVNALAAFSVSWEMFAALRFFIGLFSGGLGSVSFVYAGEFLGPKERSIFSSVPVWSIAGTSFFLTVVALKNWLYLHIVTAVVTGLGFLTVLWAPESVHWLVLNDRVDQARAVVQKVARMNRRGVPDTSELRSIAETERVFRKARSRSKYTYLDLVTVKKLRIQTLCMGFSGLFIFLAYYCLSFGVKALYGDFYVNLVLSSLVDFPAVVLIAPVARVFGRRWGCAIFVLIPCAFSVINIIVFFSGVENVKGPVITACSFCAKTVLAAAVYLMFLFFLELVPTVVRSLSIGWVEMMAMVGGMIAPGIIPNEPEKLWIAFVVMASALLVTVGLFLALPDTSGLPLQDCIGMRSEREDKEEGGLVRREGETEVNTSVV